ncbi:MAG: aspartate kinase [Bacteroidales bacterium]|nr:aspartate kinase [Bacteroidales bacterium]
MIVFKFGGASVRDSAGIKNLSNIVKLCSDEKMIVVVSALGKTTNALELILDLSYNNVSESKNKLKDLEQYHFSIIENLFADKLQVIHNDIKSEFKKLYHTLYNVSISDKNCKYDQVVSFGEIISTKIISTYLNFVNLKNVWVDARELIVTNDTFREAKVDYKKTKNEAENIFKFDKQSLYITQGFIAGTSNKKTTTLGREGSDFSAAILANVLDAEKVVVWKDVDGVLNADPQYFQNPIKLEKLSYQETVELAYFGAKVIHPKTLKPLHNKNIPLQVRSFINTQNEGTLIHCFDEYDQNLPVFILKKHQVLISLFPKDLSFVIEDELSRIFKYLSEHRIKVNLIQNSAISISFCIDNSNSDVKTLIALLKQNYKVLYNDSLELLTVRHYTDEAINGVIAGKKIFIEQRSRHTAHFVIK